MNVKSILLMMLMTTSLLWANIEITGVVTDEIGNPLEGVSVYLKSSSDMSLSDVTDAIGGYAIVGTGVLSQSVVGDRSLSLSKNNLFMTLHQDTDLLIELFGFNGKMVAELYHQHVKAGYTNISLDVGTLASGMYLLSISKNGFRQAYKQRIIDGEFTDTYGATVHATIGNTVRSRSLDTLVCDGAGYERYEMPITSYKGEHNIRMKVEGSILPDSFTKNVLFEELTGLWCGYCPHGAKKIKEKTEALGDRFIGIAIHVGDALEIPDGKKLSERYGGSGYPSCVVDRGAPMHPNSSDNQISSALNAKTSCGLSIDATKSGEVTVTAGFLKTISDDVRLTVYLLENKITNSGDYKQKDYDGVLWPGYTNDHSLADVLTEDYLGDQINADEGTTTTRTFHYDLNGTVNQISENCTIVAFLHIVGSSSSADQVLNALEVYLGEEKGFQ